MKMSKSEKIAIISFVAFAALLATFKIKSWDVWFHLSYGREVFRLGSIPETEVFLYPVRGQDVVNVEWLFGVLLYAFNYLFGISGVILFKVAIVTLAMYVLLKHSVSLTRNYALSIAVLVPVLLAARQRFNERPEIFFYLFVALLLYFISIYIYEKKKYIYLLPVITVAWANIHPSVIVPILVLTLYIVMGLVQMFISKYSGWRMEGVPDKAQCKTLFIILLLSMGATLIHPFSLEQRLAPFQIGLSQLSRDEIMEMLRPGWQFFMGVRGVLLVMLATSFALSWRRLNLVHLIISAFLVYGTLTVSRMYGPLAIVTGPIMAANFGNFYDEYLKNRMAEDWRARLRPYAYWLVIAMMAFFTVKAIVPPRNSIYQFGLGVRENQYPEGAIEYVLQSGIKGNMINTYHYGGYIEWKAFPTLSPFMDGRGLYPRGMAEDYTQVRVSKKAFRKLDKAFDLDFAIFDYIRDDNPETAKLHSSRDKGLMTADWALVYWDDNSQVFLARKPKYAHILKRDEYKFVRPSNPIETIAMYIRSESFRRGFFEEINRKLAQEPDSFKAKFFLAFFYMNTHGYREAIKAFSDIADDDISGYLRFLKYQSMGEANLRLGRDQEASDALLKAVDLSHGGDFITLHLLAQTFLSRSEYSKAISAEEEALKLEPHFVPGRKLIYDIYRSQGYDTLAELAKEKYRNAIHHSQGEKYLMKGLNYFRKNDYQRAINEFRQSIKMYPYNAEAFSYLGFSYFYSGNMEQAVAAHKKALELEPDRSGSLHGLALIYEKQNNPREARNYWKSYLKANPRGHWSRKAREKIEELKRELD